MPYKHIRLTGWPPKQTGCPQANSCSMASADCGVLLACLTGACCQHEAGRREPDGLIGGEVPRLHARHDAERDVDDLCRPLLHRQRLSGELAGALRGVVLENSHGQLELTETCGRAACPSRA